MEKANLANKPVSLFWCDYTSLEQAVFVHPSLRPSVRPSKNQGKVDPRITSSHCFPSVFCQSLPLSGTICSSPLSHFSKSSGVSEWASKRTIGRSGARGQSMQCKESEWVSGASDRANRRASGLILMHGFLVILDRSDLLLHFSSSSSISFLLALLLYASISLYPLY